MQKTSKVLLIMLAVSVTMIGVGNAFAETDSYSVGAQSGLDSGVALKVSGLTVLPGILLSLFSVWNKNLTGTGQGTNGKEVVDPRKLAINILLGIVIGVALQTLGLSTDNIKSFNPMLVQIAVVAVNYMFLHLTNLGLRPLFAHLVQFLGSYQKAVSKPSGGNSTSS